MLRLARCKLTAHIPTIQLLRTRQARKLLGAGPLLCPEQAVILEANAAKARGIARKFLATYLTLPNYTNNYVRLGYSAADFANGNSDRLIDAVVAWGDLKAVLSRIGEHRLAGADHVCIQVLTEGKQEFPLSESREIAAALQPA